jgi:Peptidase C39 family
MTTTLDQLTRIGADLDSAEIGLSRALETIRGVQVMIEAMDVGLRQPDGMLETARVPYRSQWESDAARFTSDCGPACVAMLVQFSTGQRVPIDQLSQECGMSDAHKYTLSNDMISGAAAHDVKLSCLIVTSIDIASMPCIALVHYGTLPRLDMKYTRGHWVVVVSVTGGEVTYHDPDYWGDQMRGGANRIVPIALFDQAMQDCSADGNPQGMVLVAPRDCLEYLDAAQAQGWHAGR